MYQYSEVEKQLYIKQNDITQSAWCYTPIYYIPTYHHKNKK